MQSAQEQTFRLETYFLELLCSGLPSLLYMYGGLSFPIYYMYIQKVQKKCALSTDSNGKSLECRWCF